MKHVVLMSLCVAALVFTGCNGNTRKVDTGQEEITTQWSPVGEGTDVEGVAILEFPSFEEAKAWYENPIYQKAKEHRLKGGIYRAIIVDGITK